MALARTSLMAKRLKVHLGTSLLYHSFNYSNNKFYSLGPRTQANTTLKKLKGLRSLKIVINALAYSPAVLITAILNFIVQVHGSSQNYLYGQKVKDPLTH